MPDGGRIEAQLLSEAAWTVSGSDSAGAFGPETVEASGTAVFPTDLATDLETALNASSGGNWSVTPSFGESGTGRVTITTSDTPFSVTWNSTTLRDLMGFTGNFSDSSPVTGDNHAGGVWLPGRPKITPFGDQDDGWRQTDTTVTVTRSGDVNRIYYAKRTVLDLRYEGIARARVRIQGEAVTNESLEYFWDQFVNGANTAGQVGPDVRLIWDADVDGTYTTYRFAGQLDRPGALVENWIERWNVQLPRMVKQ